MDYKELSERIEWNENKIKEVKTDLKKLKVIAQTMQLPNDTSELEIIEMFDEKYRIKYALNLTNGNRKSAATMLKVSERSLYRLINKYHLL